MEFIRWVILGWEQPLFGNGAIVPILFLTIFITGFVYVVNLIAGIILTTLVVSFWGLVAYVYLSREVKEFYAEYEKDKARESKTPR